MMKNKALLLLPLLLVSAAALAEQSILEGAAEQVITNTATQVAPDAMQAVEGAAATGQALQNAPETLNEQAQGVATEAVKQKLNEATPLEVQQGISEVKSGAQAVENVKNQADNMPKSSANATKSIKHKTNKAINKEVTDLLK